MPVKHDAAQDGPAPIPELSLEQAVDLFRLSPQECESLAIARDILLGGADELLSEHYRLLKLLPDAPKLLDSEEKIERLKLGVANWLKNDKSLETIPVVAVTILASDRDRKKILAGGCDGHIPKPISVANFLETVERFAA